MQKSNMHRRTSSGSMSIVTQPGTTRQSAVAAVRLHKMTYLDLVRLIVLQSGGVCGDQPSIVFGNDERAIGGEKMVALSCDWA
jgi:hypothetical protein